MKRRLLIFSSLITLLLSCFSFPILADEITEDSSNLHTLSDGVFLDSYFYDNYDLLPYLESSGYQYINTNVKASNNLKLEIKFSDINLLNESQMAIFGVNDNNNGVFINRYYLYFLRSNNYPYRIGFGNGYYDYYIEPLNYYVYDYIIDQNVSYINGQVVHEFPETTFESDNYIYLFANDDSGVFKFRSVCKIYSVSIYDYSLNDGEGEYVRYYYPAKAKSSGILGLYDAVSKTFISSSTGYSFSDPSDDKIESFQISSFLTNSLTWIEQIFIAIIDMPIVIIFMAIGLAGAIFRWGRRIVHF